MRNVSILLMAGFFLLQSAAAQNLNRAYFKPGVLEDIDRLLSFGVAKDTIYGQRPWSDRELERIVHAADRFLNDHPDFKEKDEIERTLLHVRTYLPHNDKLKGVKTQVLDEVSIGFFQIKSSPRDIPANNGVGFIDGYVHPLVSNRADLDLVRGQNILFETEHSLSWNPYFSLFFRPTFELFHLSSGSSDVNTTVQELYVKATVANVELEAGRDHLLWGQSEEGGFLFSNNARGLDMIKISNDSPFVHPWIFKYLGPSKYTFFVSNLGKNRTQFPYAYLYGAKASFKPFSFLEIGLSQTIITGGDGSLPMHWWDPIAEFFPVNKIGSNTFAPNVSDHKFGFFDMRLMLPWTRGSSFYFENFFEDSPGRAFHHFISDVWDEVGMKFGVDIPRILPDGSLSGNVEFRSIPPWGYRHNTWRTGYTLDRRLMGDPLGPDAYGLFVNLHHVFADTLRMKQNFAYEYRGSDQYSQTPSPSGGFEEVVKVVPGITERRFRSTSKLFWQLSPLTELVSEVGIEYVRHFNFLSDDQVNYLLGLQFNVRL